MQGSSSRIRNSALGFVVAAFVLTGCSSADVVPYPSRWPPLESPSALDCTPVSGRYREKGEHAAPSLARFTVILFGFRSPWPDAAEVALQTDADAVHVSVFDAQNVLSTKSFSAAAGDYTCDDGVVVLRTRTKVVGEGVSGEQTATLRLSVQPDGYLVLHVTAVTDGWQMLLPATWSTDTWVRFNRVDPLEKSQ